MAALYSPDEVLSLLAAAQQPRTFGCDALLKAHELQRSIVLALRAGVQDADNAHALLASFLRSVYLSVSAMPLSLRFGQLEMSIVKSGAFGELCAASDGSTELL
jgi:hypothetical protein